MQPGATDGLLTPGRRYSWVLDADGHADDSWQLSFETRQAG
jgi:hypothetical protein